MSRRKKFNIEPAKIRNWLLLIGMVGGITAFIFTLPDKIRDIEAQAGENAKINAKQDLILERLTTLQETYAQQQSFRIPEPKCPDPQYREFDYERKHYWCCYNNNYEICWDDELWKRCCDEAIR